MSQLHDPRSEAELVAAMVQALKRLPNHKTFEARAHLGQSYIHRLHPKQAIRPAKLECLKTFAAKDAAEEEIQQLAWKIYCLREGTGPVEDSAAERFWSVATRFNDVALWAKRKAKSNDVAEIFMLTGFIATGGAFRFRNTRGNTLYTEPSRDLTDVEREAVIQELWTRTKDLSCWLAPIQPGADILKALEESYNSTEPRYTVDLSKPWWQILGRRPHPLDRPPANSRQPRKRPGTDAESAKVRKTRTTSPRGRSIDPVDFLKAPDRWSRALAAAEGSLGLAFAADVWFSWSLFDQVPAKLKFAHLARKMQPIARLWYDHAHDNFLWRVERLNEIDAASAEHLHTWYWSLRKLIDDRIIGEAMRLNLDRAVSGLEGEDAQ